MKTIQVPDLDPPSALGKELVSWTLSWQPEGRCGSFTREAILAHAPPASGVYGLFNFDCQIFIGESENIQEVLLRLGNEPNFQSEQLRPTGFTFELCSEELRKTKADELIARFRPVLQTHAPAAETRSPESRPVPTAALRTGQESGADSDRHQFPSHDDKNSRIHKRFQLRQRWDVALATALITTTVIIYAVKSADSPKKQVSAAGEKPRAATASAPASSKAGLDSKRQNVASNDAVGRRAQKNMEPAAIKPDIHAHASSSNGELRLAATKTAASDEASVNKLVEPVKTIPASHPAAGANSGKKWSVQISAAPAKDVADNLVQRLTAKGYNGYVAQAEVKGQTYYRVRIGPFDAREEAESAREALAGQEEFRNAYLTAE